MIPKIIHYCWFGNNPLPPLAKKCISSWKKFLPDYEIKEWNESNFDVNIVPYTAEAYSVKKYAFVSDYARFWILYHYGGVYFDTDVEIIKSIDHIISNGAFLGCEVAVTMPGGIAINSGLGLGASSGHPIWGEILESYSSLHFIKEGGSFNNKTVVRYVTELLVQKGFIPNDSIQKVSDVWIYPSDYFGSMNYYTQEITLTDNSVSIHHYMDSWKGKKNILKRRVQDILGKRVTSIIVKIKRMLNV